MVSGIASEIFDRRLVRSHRERAAQMGAGVHPLMNALAQEMAERLLGIKQDFFN